MKDLLQMNPAEIFLANTHQAPRQLALDVSGRAYSREELCSLAMRIANWLRQENAERVGIVTSRSIGGYAGILGSIWAGQSFVPINPSFPTRRILDLITRSDLHALILDEAGSQAVKNFEISSSIRTLLIPSSEHANQVLKSTKPCETPISVDEKTMAYLMYTSGTTGDPKGVIISHHNLRSFLTAMHHRFQIGPDDRLSQSFDLNFDLSIFDLFMSWTTGASLYVVPESERLAPANFIQRNSLTVWYSVPSVIHLMYKMKTLTPSSFPSLKLSLFCGESLSLTNAQRWQQAAPQSRVENLYGPTEATVSCLAQRIEKNSAPTPDRDTLPIGKPNPETHAAILNSKGDFCDSLQEGELAIAGPQVSPGYWKDPNQTQERFSELIGPDGQARTWYRTGDLAYEDDQGTFHFVGRMDHQVKILGHRIELEEVEFFGRLASQTEKVAAVSLPPIDGIIRGMVLFVEGSDLSAAAIKAELKKRVPDYMIPQRIELVDSIPRTPNGKIDRKTLAHQLAS